MSGYWQCDVKGCRAATTKEFEFDRFGWSTGPEFYFCRPHWEHIGQQIGKYLTRVHEVGLKDNTEDPH